jgi:hypothetical protein
VALDSIRPPFALTHRVLAHRLRGHLLSMPELRGALVGTAALACNCTPFARSTRRASFHQVDAFVQHGSRTGRLRRSGIRLAVNGRIAHSSLTMKLTDLYGLVRRLDREWAVADRAFSAFGSTSDASLRAAVSPALPGVAPRPALPRHHDRPDGAPPLSDAHLQADVAVEPPSAVAPPREGPTVEQLDAVFSAFRSWRAVNATVLAQMERAVQGEPMNWPDADRQLEVLGRLQGEFVNKLKALPRRAA